MTAAEEGNEMKGGWGRRQMEGREDKDARRKKKMTSFKGGKKANNRLADKNLSQLD